MSSLKTKIVTITAEGRDKGRQYFLKEMPALKAERWARHAIAACASKDLDIREEVKALGMLGFVLFSFQAIAGGNVDAVDKLMDEMLTQIQIIEEGAAAPRPIGADGDIWEVMTLKTLRIELIELHMGFTFAELLLMLRASAEGIVRDSQSSQTSPTSSETSSQPTAEA